MRAKVITIASCGILIAVILASCATVDQFGSRIRDGNLNSQDALNQETLLNIIRSRDLQPLNFFAVTQVTGGQSEALTTGLPTVTFGPAATIAQHQSPISNSLASGVTGGYQGNPLVSTTFQSAMLSPIDLRTAALLVGSHPREPVFHAILSQIVFRTVGTNQAYALVNDPTGDLAGDDCPNRVARAEGKMLLALVNNCNYSMFLNYLGVFMNAGLTVELIPTVSTSTKPGQTPAGGGNNSQNPPTAPGHICFNSTGEFSVDGPVQPACSITKAAAPAQTAAAATKAAQPPEFILSGFGHVEADFVFRSPLGVFAYFGEILRTGEGNYFEYYTQEARGIIGTEPYLDITGAEGAPCFSSVLYNGGFYCVPMKSIHTAMLLDILIQLRNLSTQATDLNSAFTVRLTD